MFPPLRLPNNRRMSNPRRPNIVWFISDDTGPEMLGFSGGPPVTPNIDRIAATGVVCTRFHTTSAICTPSRYGYLTGLYPGHCPSRRFRELHPTEAHYNLGFDTEITPGDPNFASLFAAGGYRTGIVGKFHAGPNRSTLSPNEYKFEEDPAAPEAARKLREDYAAMQRYFHGLGFEYADGISWDNTDNRPLRALQYHNLEWQTRHALDFINASTNDQRPFALYLGVTTQHGPHHVTSLERDGVETEFGFDPEADREEISRARKSVLDRINGIPGVELNHLTAGALWMDDVMGAVVRRVEELGQAENTIFIYSTDHGPGTRSGKFTCYQGGLQIPFCMSWKGRIQAGTRCDALIQNIDLLPTLLEMADVPLPEDAACDGVSRWAQIRGAAPDDREDLYFELGRCRAVRSGRWKYIAFRYREPEIAAMKAGTVPSAYLQVRQSGPDYPLHLYPHYWDADQLYDLEADPGEQRNLAADPAYADVLKEMRQRLGRYLGRFDHPFPLDPDPYQFSPEFRALYAKNMADKSLYDVDWYRSGAW